jgi:two-component system, cell cycle sensor histidine kinase and response regulator CckA
MDTEIQQRLFEPYFTAKPAGNGLGLPNAQSIVISHKGSIKVSSEPGKGSTFRIYLDLT